MHTLCSERFHGVNKEGCSDETRGHMDYLPKPRGVVLQTQLAKFSSGFRVKLLLLFSGERAMTQLAGISQSL